MKKVGKVVNGFLKYYGKPEDNGLSEITVLDRAFNVTYSGSISCWLHPKELYFILYSKAINEMECINASVFQSSKVFIQVAEFPPVKNFVIETDKNRLKKSKNT